MDPKATQDASFPMPGTPDSPTGGPRATERPLPSELVAGLEPLLTALSHVIQGNDVLLRSAVTCLIAGGHLLLEDVPGTGKTTLAKALAAASGLSLQRIQMTSDLLPQDLTGASYPVLDSPPSAGDPMTRLSFIPGPIFSELLLADELNRTPPRTQSALLEAMAERAVTIEGQRHPLPWPFFVIATQNPIEFAGTFPLPESQLDRFMMRLSPGYPGRQAERQLLRDRRSGDPLAALPGAGSRTSMRSAIRAAMEAVDHIAVAEPIFDYILDLIAATRSADSTGEDERLHGAGTSPFLLGASPRAALDLDRAARARALLEGRDHVIPEDVLELTTPVLAHRLIPVETGYDGQSSSAALLARVTATIPVPRISGSGAMVR